jgi:hypothetical protein
MRWPTSSRDRLTQRACSSITGCTASGAPSHHSRRSPKSARSMACPSTDCFWTWLGRSRPKERTGHDSANGVDCSRRYSGHDHVIDRATDPGRVHGNAGPDADGATGGAAVGPRRLAIAAPLVGARSTPNPRRGCERCLPATRMPSLLLMTIPRAAGRAAGWTRWTSEELRDLQGRGRFFYEG